MNVQIDQYDGNIPIRVSMSYAEALNIVHALTHIIPKGENYPNTRKLLEALESVVSDQYFD